MAVTFRNDNLELVPLRYVPPAVAAREESPSWRLQYLFVAVVEALARAGWDVPGVDVRFGNGGRGGAGTRSVESISWSTPEGPASVHVWGGYGPHRFVVPPGMEVTFQGPDSHPLIGYFLTGKWRAMVPDRFGRLEAPDAVRFRHVGGGQYGPDPEGSLPSRARRAPRLADVVDDVQRFLEDLETRLSELPESEGNADVTEEGTADLRRLVARDLVPVPEDFPVLYSWLDRSEAHRVVHPSARHDDGSQDFVLAGNGGRVVPLGGRRADGSRPPEDSYRGFSYASADPSVRAKQTIASTESLVHPVAVRLRCLNQVFVVDDAKFEEARDATFERLKGEGRDRMTDRELDACMAEVGATIVPAAEYDGSFASPTYLIGRQLGPDEARLATGRVTHLVDGDHERVVLSGEDGEFTLFDDPQPSRSERDRAKEVAAEAKSLVAVAAGSPFRRLVPLPGPSALDEPSVPAAAMAP